MQATRPHVTVPGDREDRIMARSGSCVGMSDKYAVWRFGFREETSDAGKAYGVTYGLGFMWVIATRKRGLVQTILHDKAYNELPDSFKNIVNWEPN